MAKEMKRYDKWHDEMDEAPQGAWVLYEEAAERINKLERELADERARVDWLVPCSLYCDKFGQWKESEDRYSVGCPGDTIREAIDRERSKT